MWASSALESSWLLLCFLLLGSLYHTGQSSILATGNLDCGKAVNQKYPSQNVSALSTKSSRLSDIFQASVFVYACVGVYMHVCMRAERVESSQLS